MEYVKDLEVPNVDQAKAAAALTFHHEIRDAVERNLEDDEYVEHGYNLNAIVGNAQPTLQSARMAGAGVELERRYEGEDHKGDGTVPRVSATPLEVEDERGATYSNERHPSLQNAEPVLVQLIGTITARAVRTGRFRAIGGTALELDVEDTYLEHEPIGVRVRPEAPLAEPLVAVAEDAETRAEVRRVRLPRQPDGFHAGELGALDPGVYRLTVEGDPAAEPVHELLSVLPAVPDG